MEFERVKELLEGASVESSNAGSIDALPSNFYDPFILQGLQVDHVEPGRLLCSMKVPPRLVNTGGFLHGGAIASLVDLIGSVVIFTVGSQTSGLALEINVSYMSAAFLDEEIEIESRVLRVGKTIGVVSVELRKKKSGKIFAQGRHTKYLAFSKM